MSDADRAIVNTWALHGEKVVHGNPSGLDNTMSVYGNDKRGRKAMARLLVAVDLILLILLIFFAGGAVTYTGGRFSPLEKCVAIVSVALAITGRIRFPP